MSKTWRTTCLLAAGACLFLAPAGAKAGLRLRTGNNPAPPLAQAQWIAPPASADGRGPLPLLRKEFSVDAKPAQGDAPHRGLGRLRRRASMARVWRTRASISRGRNTRRPSTTATSTSRRLVQPGSNCVGVMLGNSFWHNPNPPAGPLQQGRPAARGRASRCCSARRSSWSTTNGTLRRIGTDATWRTSDGPGRVLAHLRRRGFRRAPPAAAVGTARDSTTARGSRPAWRRPPRRVSCLRHWPPFKAQERFSPASVKQPAPGVFLYSFPQNCSAQLRVELAGGKPGDRVAFRCGEHKNAQDRLFGGYVVGCDLVTDGRPIDSPVGLLLPGHAVRRSLRRRPGRPGQSGASSGHPLAWSWCTCARPCPRPARSQCSSDLFNRTHRLIDWAMRSNTSHVLTDCPHREKLGWLECAYLLAPSFQYRYDCRDWFAKILRDIRDAQEPSGRVLTVAPSYPAGRFPGAVQLDGRMGRGGRAAALASLRVVRRLRRSSATTST